MRIVYQMLLFSTTLAAPMVSVPQGADKVPGQYIVKLKHDEAVFSISALTVLKQSLSAPPRFEYSMSGFHGFAGKFSIMDLANLHASNHVEYIQPDIKMHAYNLIYQDPAPWGLGRISHREPGNQTYIFDDSAGEGVCAYVIDTGIFLGHPDLEGRAQHLANFSDDKRDEDGEGHGTHVAGTIGSRTYGVAKKARLLAVKVLDSYGLGTTAGIIAGVNFVTKDAATRNCPKGAVANMSLGGRKNMATDQAVAAAVASGIFFAVAAGNGGMDAKYSSPASEPSVCTVGATSMNDSMPPWSNWGPYVDVLAPGVNITSLNNDGGTALHEGTSMATPHVTGLAAYLLALEGCGTKNLCERIASLGTKGVVKNVRKETANILINDGAPSV